MTHPMVGKPQLMRKSLFSRSRSSIWQEWLANYCVSSEHLSVSPYIHILYFLGSFRMASHGSYWRGYTSNHIRILHLENPPVALWLPSGGLLGGCPCIGHSVDYLRPTSLSTVRGETQGITGSGDLNGQILHNPLWKVIPKAAIPLWGREKEMIISKKRSAHSLLLVVC